MPTLAQRGGVPGLGGVLAIPGRKFGAARSKPFRSSSFSTRNAAITGVTRDSAGLALAACTVDLFRTVDDLLMNSTVSDVSGNYTFYPTVAGPYYIVAYLAGAPDVAGTTVQTLLPA